MPLPSDEQTLKTSQALVDQFQAIFGKHPGFRPAHARGILLSGIFTPTPEAKALSSAPHLNNPSTEVTVRFSSSTGIPQIPDTDPNANPRGLAVRFHLGGRAHTDFIAHSTPFFPTRTGAEFLEFLQAVAASPPGTASPSPVEQFLGSHPAALAFVQAPKPAPATFANEVFYGVNALKFVSANGQATYFRYRVLPDAGEVQLGEAELKDKDANFLFAGVPNLVRDSPISFSVFAQIAEEGDVTDDATVHWPESRSLVKLGSLKLEKLVDGDTAQQKQLIFDPIPRVQGIEASEDPLLEMRAAVYLISGRQRRAA